MEFTGIMRGANWLGLALFGVEFGFLFVLVPEAVDLADVAGGGEGRNLVIVDEVHEFGELVLVKEGFEFDGFLVGVAADDLIHGAAALKIVDDETAQTVILLGDDADALLVVEGSGEVVDHKAVDPSADKADDHHAEGVDGKGGAADDSASDGDRGANVKMEVFVDDFGQDVEAAGGGVDGEH